MMNPDQKKAVRVLTVVVAAVVLLFGTIFALSSSSKPKIKSSNTVAKKSAPPSTILSPAPTTALPAPTTINNACKALVGNIVNLNYKHPTLNPAVINSLAVPKLAQAILAAPHMTPGEIAQQEVLTPQLIVGGNMGPFETLVSVGSPVNLTMDCYTQKTSSGNYIVTKLVRQ